MKTSDLGLVFDDKLSRSHWTNLKWVDGQPDELWFGTVKTSLGNMTVIGAGDALCYLGFIETRSIVKCRKFFKEADFVIDMKRAEKMVKSIMKIWKGDKNTPLTIMVGGTPFQMKVWQALMKIPTGHAVSYGTIASSIGSPKAVRAVGTAVGSNPISLLIPCHRVVQQSGKVENYGWGDAMKQGILKAEAAAS